MSNVETKTSKKSASKTAVASAPKKAVGAKKAVEAKKAKPQTKKNVSIEKKGNGVDYSKNDILLSVKHLKQYFRFGSSGPRKYLKAVHDVSFDVHRGEVFGLVGESGCGKTTTGRDILKLYKITSGDIWLDGIRVAAGTRWNEKEIKFTLLRSHNAVKSLQAEKNKAIQETKKLLEEQSKKKDFLFSSKVLLSEYTKRNIALPKSQEIENLFKQIREIDKKIATEKAKCRDITSIQRDKIRLARKDDKNANKNIARSSIATVNAKYADLLKKINDSSASSLTEEDREKYNDYKVASSKAKHASLSNKVQMIFQDPIASLNPRMTVRNIIAEGLIIQGCHDKKFIDEEVAKVLQMVGLVPEHANRYPHEFSGGQRQRIGIARAIIMNPELIVADEPVSALDVSVQAQVINLLNDLRNDLGLTLIFIAHNLSVVKYFCDRIAVMYYGNLVELASSEELFLHPLHPYTKSLLSAVPYPDPIVETTRKRIVYDPAASHDYSIDKPSFVEITPGHFLYCNEAEKKAALLELGVK